MDFGSSLMSVRSYMTVYLCVCQCVFVGRTVRLGTVLCQVWWPACVLGRYITTQSRQTVGQTTSSAHPGHYPFLDHITMRRIICSLLLQMQHGLCVCLLVPGKRLNWWRCHLGMYGFGQMWQTMMAICHLRLNVCKLYDILVPEVGQCFYLLFKT